jgi:hypothetical protein
MQLQAHERHMACLLSGLLIGLSLVVLFDHRPLVQLGGEYISVHVVGAVDETQLQVKEGTTLEDLLSSIRVRPDADLSELDSVRRLIDGEVIVVPFEGKKTVYVTGAVEEAKVVTIPCDAGVAAILQSVNVRNNADVRSFLRRKRVKNGEIIEIRAKKEVKSAARSFKQ